MYDCIFGALGGKAFLGEALVVAQDTTVDLFELRPKRRFCVYVCCYCWSCV